MHRRSDNDHNTPPATHSSVKSEVFFCWATRLHTHITRAEAHNKLYSRRHLDIKVQEQTSKRAVLPPRSTTRQTYKPTAGPTLTEAPTPPPPPLSIRVERTCLFKGHHLVRLILLLHRDRGRRCGVTPFASSTRVATTAGRRNARTYVLHLSRYRPPPPGPC